MAIAVGVSDAHIAVALAERFLNRCSISDVDRWRRAMAIAVGVSEAHIAEPLCDRAIPHCKASHGDEVVGLQWARQLLPWCG